MKRFLLLFQLLCLAMGTWASFTPEEKNEQPQGSTVIFFDLKLNDYVVEPSQFANSYDVAAFIDGECRALADVQVVAGGRVNYSYLQLVVPGNYSLSEEDNGKEITFQLYMKGTQSTYNLTTDQNVEFGPQKTYGLPSSDHVQLYLTTPTNIQLQDITMELGETVSLADYLTLTPASASLPMEARWRVSNQQLATIADGKLTAKTTGEATYSLVLPGGYDAAGSVMYSTYTAKLTVVSLATAINVAETTYETYMGKDDELNEFLNRVCSLEPSTTTEKVTWQIGDETIIGRSDTDASFTLLSPGQTTMTPVILKSDGTVRLSGQAITITVKQLVESLTATTNSITCNVGDDNILSRLEQLITIAPSNATNKTLTWSIAQDGVLGMNNGTVIALKAGTTRVTTATTDGSNLSAVIAVVVEDPATVATFSQNPMTIAITNNDGTDISTMVFENISLNGSTPKNGTITISSTPDDAVTGRAAITDDGINGTIMAYKQGTATVTVTLTWTADHATATETSQSYSFQLNITENLSLTSFTVVATPDDNSIGGTVTLTPIPANANFDMADYQLVATTATGTATDYGTWQPVEIIADDQNPLAYTYSAQLPGQFTFQVMKGSEVFAESNSVEVPFALSFESGWQWKSNNFIDVTSYDDITALFGQNMKEARTQSSLLFNDPSWGYVGSMLNGGIAKMQMYKVNMTTGAKAYVKGGSMPRSLTTTLDRGWNWVGSPYFYNRNLSTAIPTANLTEGLVIQGKDGAAELQDGQWNGNLTTINSGEGYLIYNPGTASVSMTWATEVGSMAQGDDDAAGARAARASVWSYDASRFANNMTMVATLQGIDHPEYYTLGAFVDGECRGEGVCIDGRMYVTAHVDDGEQVSFVLYNEMTGTYANIDQSIKAKTRIGSVKAPMELTSEQITLGISSTTATTSAQAVFDLQGRKVVGTPAAGSINIVRMKDGSVRKIMK